MGTSRVLQVLWLRWVLRVPWVLRVLHRYYGYFTALVAVFLRLSCLQSYCHPGHPVPAGSEGAATERHPPSSPGAAGPETQRFQTEARQGALTVTAAGLTE